jgi:hypothetical protein
MAMKWIEPVEFVGDGMVWIDYAEEEGYDARKRQPLTIVTCGDPPVYRYGTYATGEHTYKDYYFPENVKTLEEMKAYALAMWRMGL